MFRVSPAIAAVILVALGLCCAPAPAKAADAGKGEEVTILRDEFGIPNVFAETDEGAVFGAGYAQAEDRLEYLLKQYRRCEGTMSEAFGPENLREDYRQRVWRHRAIAEENFPKLSPKTRAMCEAYQDGIKQYMQEHPSEVPPWAPELHPWQIVALGRYSMWGWPEMDAGGDLVRAGIMPDPVPARGSNEWTVTAGRTADGVPFALIDPHLTWYGPFRFYEQRLYGGELQLAGMAIPGLPVPSLGHSRYCSVAMTTGGPDAADVYVEELNPDHPRQYKYDGKWENMTVRHEVIRVKEAGGVKEHPFDIEYTRHGPVVAHRKGKGYALKLPYLDEYRMLDQSYAMSTAKNLAEMKQALAMLQLVELNVMVATVEGDIYYVRNGRVPVRPAGYDWKRPVPGNTSKTEWLGLHPFEDLLQLTNPWQGYMQNCNCLPEFMTQDCPLTPDRYADRPYLYNQDNGFFSPPMHQRAAMVRQILDLNGRMTLPEAIDLAMCPQVYNAELWQARLANAWAKADAKVKNGDAAKLYELAVRWNRRLDADSVGAVAYQFWKDQVWKNRAIRTADNKAEIPPEVPPQKLVQAVVDGAAELKKKWGRLDVKYGEIYRVGREGSQRTWPVGGGSIEGMATPRAVGFKERPDHKTFLAWAGQTSTQLVQMTNPPRSWTLLPLGESDHPDSKHFDDQAEKLFSPGKLKPTYFLNKEELLKHVESKRVLHRPLK